MPRPSLGSDKPSGRSQIVHVKMPGDLIAMIDAEVARWEEMFQGSRMGRSDMIRILLYRGLLATPGARAPKSAAKKSVKKSATKGVRAVSLKKRTKASA